MYVGQFRGADLSAFEESFFDLLKLNLSFVIVLLIVTNSIQRHSFMMRKES